MAPEMVGFSNASELATPTPTGMEDAMAIPLWVSVSAVSADDAGDDDDAIGVFVDALVGVLVLVLAVVDDVAVGTVKPPSSLAVV